MSATMKEVQGPETGTATRLCRRREIMPPEGRVSKWSPEAGVSQRGVRAREKGYVLKIRDLTMSSKIPSSPKTIGLFRLPDMEIHPTLPAMSNTSLSPCQM